MKKALFIASLLASPLAAQTPMQEKIEHVVVLMLENRSYDHILGWLYSDNNSPRNFIPEDTDPTHHGLTDEILPFYVNEVRDDQGNLIFSSPPIKGVPSVADGKYLNSPQFFPYETFPHILKQMYSDPSNNEPTMKGFLQDYASSWWQSDWQGDITRISAIMESYTEEELPIIYNLARHYAVSDEWFCSVPTDTNPNRAFLACGTSEGQIVNGPLTRSLFYSDTIWNRLTELSPDTSWKIFWQANFLTGIISGPYTGPNSYVAMNKIPDLESHYESIADFHERARNGTLPSFSFIEPEMQATCEIIAGLPFQGLHNFRFMIGTQGNDMHPPSDVRTTETLIANIYTSLIANKEAWEKTLLIITFDEHGGTFDHVPPPQATPPDSHFENGFMFDRYGVRVPTIFISPLIDKSTIIRSDKPGIPFDHTSVISTLFNWKNINKNLWNMGMRAAVAPTFDKVITRKIPRLDSIVKPLWASVKAKDTDNAINMGDAFYLRDNEGNYLQKSEWIDDGIVYAGSIDNRAVFTFKGGSGAITHG